MNPKRDNLLKKRSEILSDLGREPDFDVIVIGGGIHGAAVAWELACRNVKTLLLEKRDYAWATSSRSSKMAHGGLRYLEMFDFQQVFEGIKAREELFDIAAHCVKPEKFLIPVATGDIWFRLKLGIGLYLYDLMVRNAEHRHSWIPRKKLSFSGFHSGRQDLAGCYQYVDGLMNDARLVIENVIGARSAGATCLNYAEVVSVTNTTGQAKVLWRDSVSNTNIESNARLVVNCAGPWAPTIQGVARSKSSLNSVKFSRGSHLLFSVPWKDPSLFLPMEEKGRYYFVWPHYSGTMVGTTERDIDSLEEDPVPTKDEVDEILTRLAKDLPDSGLNRNTLHYAFAGVRTLPLRDGSKSVSQLSRKHIWKLDGSALTLLGGKYTTYAWTAKEGAMLAMKSLDLPFDNRPGKNYLPGFLPKNEAGSQIIKLAERSVPMKVASRAVSRLGPMLSWYENRPGALDVLPDGVMNAEVLHAFEIEQAVTIEDLMRRRIDLEFMPGSGFTSLPAIERIVSGFESSEVTLDSMQKFMSKVKEISKLLKL